MEEKRDALLEVLREEWRRGCDNGAVPGGIFQVFLDRRFGSAPIAIAETLRDYDSMDVDDRRDALKRSAQILAERTAHDRRVAEAHRYFSDAKTQQERERGFELFTEDERESAYAMDLMGVSGYPRLTIASLYQAQEYIAPSRQELNAVRRRYGLSALAGTKKTLGDRIFEKLRKKKDGK